MKRYIDADKLFAYVDGQAHLSKGKVMHFIRENDIEGNIVCWISPKDELSGDPYESVLAQVTGKSGNVVFEDALELATYSEEDGWILENYPETEIEITKWMQIPEVENDDKAR